MIFCIVEAIVKGDDSLISLSIHLSFVHKETTDLCVLALYPDTSTVEVFWWNFKVAYVYKHIICK